MLLQSTKEALEPGKTKERTEQALKEAEQKLEEKAPVYEEIEEVSFWMSKELKILLKNEKFKEIYKGLASKKIKRVMRDVLLLEEEAVIKHYTTTEGYERFNKALRGEISTTEEFIAQEKLLNQALDKLPAYNTDKILYRIENLTEEQIKNYYIEGKTVTNKHFTSSTHDIKALRDAAWVRKYTCIINIEGKNGRLIENVSTFYREREVLFKSKTKFYVKKVGYTLDPKDPDDFTKLIREITLIEK